jgi:hypothetical protein
MLARGSPFCLESQAQLVNAASHLDIQVVEVIARPVAHLDLVLGPWPTGLHVV